MHWGKLVLRCVGIRFNLPGAEERSYQCVSVAACVEKTCTNVIRKSRLKNALSMSLTAEICSS